ncbi:MAG TPA: DUF3108 domain-containing protein [Longimicrobiales bacterium]
MNSLIRTTAIAAAALIASSAQAVAQTPIGRPVAAEEPKPEPTVAPVPFGPGERLGYQVRLGIFGEVGEGAMEVVGVDTIHGRPTYHLRFDLEGKVLFAEVDDRLQSWLDVSSLVARRFEQDQKEVNFERHRIFDFFPEQGRYERVDREGGGELATDQPLDDVSFLYFVRTLPLEVGETYTLNRYYKADGNPVTIRVLRKETITVPAGTFETIVVQPIIQTDGLFGEGGEAEVYFTDDEQRLLIQMKSKVPVIGHLSLHLKSYTPGARLAATPTSEAGT